MQAVWIRSISSFIVGLTILFVTNTSFAVSNPCLNELENYPELHKLVTALGGRFLSDEAATGKLPKTTGRMPEIRRIAQALTLTQRKRPVLFADGPGTGRRSTLEGFANWVVNGGEAVPSTLRGKHIVLISIGALSQGNREFLDHEKRVAALFAEVQKSDGQIILFIDDLHRYMSTELKSSANRTGIEAILSGAIRNPNILLGFQMLRPNWENFKVVHPELADRLEAVEIAPMDQSGTRAVAISHIQRIEAEHGVHIPVDAINHAIAISERYLKGVKSNPGATVELLEKAAAQTRSLMSSGGSHERAKLEDELETLLVSMNHYEKVKAQGRASALALEELAQLEKRKIEIENELKRLATNAATSQSQQPDESLATKELKAKIQEKEKELANKPKTEKEMLTMTELAPLKAQLRRLQNETPPATLGETGGLMVTQSTIDLVASEWAKVPIGSNEELTPEKALTANEMLGARVIGQARAVEAVSAAVSRVAAGMNNPTQPIGSFLFTGPTGVGKTELARALAHFLFGNEAAMIRLDMSEYQEKHTVSRMIGPPPGYVGYEEGGQLTNAVRRKPYSVILLDEIEKAHSDVFDVLLQVLDEGHLTDGQGQRVDFKNTLILMTSNAGSEIKQRLKKLEKEIEQIQERLAEARNGTAETEEEIAQKEEKVSSLEKENADLLQERSQLEKLSETALSQHFKPEFLNRLTDKIEFEDLDPESLRKIARIKIKSLAQFQGLVRRGLKIEIGPGVEDRLIEMVKDEAHFGARPIVRAILNDRGTSINDQISEFLLRNPNVPRGSTLLVGVDESGSFVISIKQ